MIFPPSEYCGDEAMTEFLKKAGSELTISGLYGLLYGCHAAPNLVKPSQVIPLIFGEKEAGLDSEEEASTFMGNLLLIWNVLAQWNPETDDFMVPDVEYPDGLIGVKQRIQDDVALVGYFIKGLDLGETGEDDFTEDAHKAMESLAKTGALLVAYIELLEKEESNETQNIENITNLIDHVTGVIADCIARINLGLKGARLRALEEMRMFIDTQKKAHQVKSTKIPRNEPCPCGSGKKYKKCCGLMH